MSKKARRRRRGFRGWMIGGVAVAVAATLFVLAGGPVLNAVGLTNSATSTVTPGYFESVAEPTGNGVPQAVEPTPVATARSTSGSPVASEVAARLKAVKRKDIGTLGMAFLDADGEDLYGESQNSLLTPASNLKVLSSMAALKVLGPGRTFQTTVVSNGDAGIVLVGGGDPFLTSKKSTDYPQRASMADLASQTAAKLKKQGTSSVTLGYDTSLFTGPAWNPDWTDSYKSEVAPIVPLTVDQSRSSVGMPRTTPVEDAVSAFATQLTAQGITVTSRKATTAAKDATKLAAVSSPSVEVIVEQLLLHSDNDAAEILGRHTAMESGRPGSFAGATEAITEALTELKLFDEGAVIRDASGLSKSNRVTPNMLARSIHDALHSDRYSPVIGGLPLAGVSGTLQSRYSSSAGRGQVWAKTGFLTGIHGLTGLLVTKDGDVVVFAMIVNGQSERGVAQPVLDSLTSAVVDCGCST